MATNKPRGMAPLTTPVFVQLHPTNRCNAHCRFCWLHDREEDFKEIPDTRWQELADDICALDVPKVTISGGGEPLLKARLVLQLMEKFSRAGIEGALITNGTLITEQVADRMVELEWGSVQVSIHAPTAQHNDSLMGKKGSFNLALRGIRTINAYKHLRKSAFPQLTVRMVVTNSNFPTLPEFIRLAKSLKVEVVAVRMVNEHETPTKGPHPLSESERQQFKDIARQARKAAKDAGIALDFEFEMELPPADEGESHHQSVPPPKEPKGSACGARGESAREASCPIPFSELVIFPNGTATTCCNFYNLQFESEEQRAGWLEDLTNQPLGKVWQGGFAALRSSMFSEKMLCLTCRRCSIDMEYQRNHWQDSFFHQRFRHLRKHKRYGEGIQFGLEQLKEHADNAVLLHYIGEFHMHVEEYDKAIKVLERLESLGGKVEGLQFLLGRCHFKSGEYKKALERFERNLSPSASRESQFHTWYSLALCHQKLRNYGRMKHCFNKAEEFTELFCKEEHFEEKQLREFVEQWPSSFFNVEFRHFRSQDGYRKGISFGLAQLKEHPDNPVLHHHIGEFHMEVEEYGKAVCYLSKAVELDHMMEWTHFSLGKCYFLTRQYDKAERALKDNLRVTSDRLSHFHSWLFLAMIADARKDEGACQKALENLKRYRNYVGNEIPLEKEFLRRLEQKKRLPEWLKKEGRM